MINKFRGEQILLSTVETTKKIDGIVSQTINALHALNFGRKSSTDKNADDNAVVSPPSEKFSEYPTFEDEANRQYALGTPPAKARPRVAKKIKWSREVKSIQCHTPWS